MIELIASLISLAASIIALVAAVKAARQINGKDE